MARYLGIDLGEKRVGIAVSDPGGIIAQPVKTVPFQSGKQLLREIDNLVKEYEIEKIVIGLPLTMKGTDSEKTREVREFAEVLSRTVSVPVHFMDERLTTVQAHSTMHQIGKKPSRHRERVDQLAAQLILQTFLDQEKSRRRYE